MTTLTVVLVCVAVLLAVLLAVSLKVIPEYQRAVALRFGHVRPLLQPGLRVVLPFVDSVHRVDLRTIVLTIPPQEVITKDNVPARVNAVVMFRVVDPLQAILEVENYTVATSQIAQTTLRSLLGRVDLDTLLAHRDDLGTDMGRIIARQTDGWGIEVVVVEIKDVEIPEAMQRAMAREAEAERERRAKVINARGELQASEQLRDAAARLSEAPASIQLRYLQTLLELGADQNSTVVFPLPLDILSGLAPLAESMSRAARGLHGSQEGAPATSSTATPDGEPRRESEPSSGTGPGAGISPGSGEA